jgi:hypothetical protein
MGYFEVIFYKANMRFKQNMKHVELSQACYCGSMSFDMSPSDMAS